jgi:hypothetical protein
MHRVAGENGHRARKDRQRGEKIKGNCLDHDARPYRYGASASRFAAIARSHLSPFARSLALS